MARSDHFTELSKRPTRYVDFSRGFERNPITGDLALVTDVASVKQSISNLVLCHRGERFFQPTLGCRAHDLLFEQPDDVTMNAIEQTVSQAIQFHEPRARLISVVVSGDPNNDQVAVTVAFYVQNIPEPVSLTLFLKRVR